LLSLYTGFTLINLYFVEYKKNYFCLIGGTSAGTCASGFGVCCTCEYCCDVIRMCDVKRICYVTIMPDIIIISDT
jgi:hypothetical protein